MMILNELRKHGRLAARRHPMYEKNKVAKNLSESISYPSATKHRRTEE